jgi:peptidoglycan/xylan/chitin deacetylase (PgdA/CDA1 family)
MSAGPPRDLVGYGRRPPQAVWPEGAKVAVNLVMCYEEGSEYSLLHGDNRQDGWGEYPTFLPISQGRDLGTESHFEYGSRVGVWRLARLYDGLGVPVTVSATALALQLNPEVAAWMREQGHDLLGHGYRWVEQWIMSRAEEREQIGKAIALFEEVYGERPLGWNSRTQPGVNTRELLVEEGGFLYESDPNNDDVPYFVDVDGTRLLIVPYSKTFNDSRYLIAPGYSNPHDFAEHCKLGLDYFLREAEETDCGKMMTVAVHARWTGQPNRAAGLREFVEYGLGRPGVRFMRRLDIANWWLDRHADFER